MPDTCYLVPLSDEHAGHKLGLCRPGVKLFQEHDNGEQFLYTPELTESQVYLWQIHEWARGEIMELAGDNQIVVVHNGDVTHSSIRYAEQVMSTREVDHVAIAEANLSTWLDMKQVTSLVIIIGTGAHNGGQGSNEIVLAKMLQNKYPNKRIKVCYHGLLDIGGCVVDIAHHGAGGGARYWLEGNAARWGLIDLMGKELRRGNVPAALYIRAHCHPRLIDISHDESTIDKGGRVLHYKSRLLITPPLCWLDDHATKAARSPIESAVGMCAVRIENGGITDVLDYSIVADIRSRIEVL